MPLDPHSIEFTRLAQRWLDETASAEEAARLWQAVAECPECAREFAAMTRFEHLLQETVVERTEEKRTVAALAALAEPRVAPAGGAVGRRAPAWNMRNPAVRLAAVLALLGLIIWMVWPEEKPSGLVQKTPAPAETQPGKSALVQPKAPAWAGAPGMRTGTRATTPGGEASRVPLLVRLDTFFLSGVALDKMPLSQALGVLQGQLQELNSLNADDLKKLRVTVPAGAAERRVSFRSGPIAFLKAVRAVAALGGCDVSVDEQTLALVLHQEIFPQIAEKRDVRDLLKGRVNSDGSAAITHPDRLAALVADAASLGIPVAPDSKPEALASLPVTRGQWEALLMLTAAREQLNGLLAPSLQLYVSEVDPGKKEKDGVLDEEETAKASDERRRQGSLPLAVLTPRVAPFAVSQADLLPFTVRPAGDQLELVIPPPVQESPLASTPQQPLLVGNVTGVYGIGNLNTGTLALNDAGTITNGVNHYAGITYGGAGRTETILGPGGGGPITVRVTGYTYDQAVAMIRAAGGTLSTNENGNLTGTLGGREVNVIIVTTPPQPQP